MCTNYLSLLKLECPSKYMYLIKVSGKGMGFVLSAAGGGDWPVENEVRQAAAALLLQRRTILEYDIPKLCETELCARDRLVWMVLSSYKKIKQTGLSAS